MSQPVAQFVNVGHQYEEGPEIFKGATFDIEQGSFYFLTGPSGSGKSSLLQMLYLGLKPKWGSIRLFGEDPLHMKAKDLPLLRQQLGVVFQEFKLLDHLNVLDNVTLPLRVRGINPKEALGYAEELLTWVGLKDALHIFPSVLSGGQKQRVAIARAIVTKPRLILADEPTGNVDDAIALKIIRLFEELNKMGATVIIATHNSRLLETFPNPRLTIQEGTIAKITPEGSW